MLVDKDEDELSIKILCLITLLRKKVFAENVAATDEETKSDKTRLVTSRKLVDLTSEDIVFLKTCNPFGSAKMDAACVPISI